MLTAPGFDAILIDPIFAPCKGIQGKIEFSEFQAMDSGFQVVDTRSWFLDSED